MNVRAADFFSYEVSDINRAVAFYRDTLGLKLDFCDPELGWAEFEVKPTSLALYSPVKSMKRPPKVGGAMIWLAVEDVAAAVEELKAKGVEIVLGKMDTPVCEMAVFTDPDGNEVGLHHRKDGTAG